MKMKTESWIILEVGGALIVLGLLAAFWTPAYEKGFWYIITIFGVQFANLLGGKKGSEIPQQLSDQKPGQTTEMKTTTETAPPPPPTN